MTLGLKKRSILCVLTLVFGGVFGCAPDASKVDSSRSYFDGGALSAPNPSTCGDDWASASFTGAAYQKPSSSFGELSASILSMPRDTASSLSCSSRMVELRRLRSFSSLGLLSFQIQPCCRMISACASSSCVTSTERASAFCLPASFPPTDAVYSANYAMVLGLQGRYQDSLDLYARVIPHGRRHFECLQARRSSW